MNIASHAAASLRPSGPRANPSVEDDPTHRIRATVRIPGSNTAPGELQGHLVDWRRGTFVFVASNAEFVRVNEYPMAHPGQRVSLAIHTTRPGQPYQIISRVVSTTHRPFDDTVYLHTEGADPVANMLAHHLGSPPPTEDTASP